MPYADAGAGVRLYYEVTGEGEPLLLIPGFGCTVEIYFANAPTLAQNVRVIVFDPRTLIVLHYRRDGTHRLTSPHSFVLECGCACTV